MGVHQSPYNSSEKDDIREETKSRHLDHYFSQVMGPAEAVGGSFSHVGHASQSRCQFCGAESL